MATGFTMQLVGLGALNRRIESKINRITNDTRSIVSTRAQEMNKSLNAQLSGKKRFPVGVSRAKFGSVANLQGSGLEIFDEKTKRGTINLRSSRMKNALRTIVSLDTGEISAELGFDKNIAPDNPGRVISHALNWPGKIDAGVVIGPNRTTPFKNQTKRSGGESPERYIPKILLGTDRILGRNILRMVLLNDIKSSKTLKRLMRAWRNAVQ
jgi:hypothetical protein